MKQLNIPKIEEDSIFKGTIVEEVCAIMASGQQFPENGKPAVKPSEQILGKMNALEKTLEGICTRCGQAEAPIVSRFRGEGKPFASQDEEKQAAKDLAKIRARFKLATNWLWDSVTERFADKVRENSGGIALRSGFQVVSFPEDPAADFVEKLFGGLVISISSED